MTVILGTLAQPVEIKRGQKISQSGIYLIDADWYHDDCCTGPSTSSSQLKDILLCPLKAWQKSYLNPNRLPEIKKTEPAFFDFGKAAHTLFLGDEIFQDKYLVREIENEDWKDWKKKDPREWRSKKRDEGYGILTMDDMERLRRVAAVVGQDSVIRDNRLLEGYIERSLIYFDRRRGIFVKVRPDVLPPLDLTVTDLKTIGQNADLKTIQRQLNNLEYHIQQGLISWVYRKLFGLQLDKFWLLMIENDDFPAYSLNEINKDDVYLGEQQALMALDILAKGLATNEWPTYSTHLEGELYLYDDKRERIKAALAAHDRSFTLTNGIAAE